MPQALAHQTLSLGGSCGHYFVHYFKTDVGTVQYIRPGADNATLAIQDGLVEVESVQVDRRRGQTPSRYRVTRLF